MFQLERASCVILFYFFVIAGDEYPHTQNADVEQDSTASRNPTPLGPQEVAICNACSKSSHYHLDTQNSISGS